MTKATPEQQLAMDHFNDLRATREGQMMSPVKEFLRSWSNEKMPTAVYDKALAVLDEQDKYTPEKVIHRIVLVTVQSWVERNQSNK